MLRRFWLFVITGLVPVSAVAQTGPGSRMNGNNTMDETGYMNGYGHMMDFWGGHVITWILLLIVVGVLVYVIARAAQTHHSDASSHESPIEVLKRRYAQGDISKEQFEEMKRDL